MVDFLLSKWSMEVVEKRYETCLNLVENRKQRSKSKIQTREIPVESEEIPNH